MTGEASRSSDDSGSGTLCMVSLARMTLMATSATAPPGPLRCRSRARSTLEKTPRPCVANTSYRSFTSSPTCRVVGHTSVTNRPCRVDLLAVYA